MTDVTEPLTCTIEDGVAVIRLDDGKANAVSHRLLELLDESLDRARAEAAAVAIIGRPGRFSAGFDLSVIGEGVMAARALVGGGGRMLMRVFTHPQPVVAGVTGHALAAGALLALACDTRIGADVPAKIGLNETAIGMGLPDYALALVEARVPPAFQTRSAIQGEIFDAATAVEAGYLDRVVPAEEVEQVAIEEARRLGQLPNHAYWHTKRGLRMATAERVLADLEADVARMLPD